VLIGEAPPVPDGRPARKWSTISSPSPSGSRTGRPFAKRPTSTMTRSPPPPAGTGPCATTAPTSRPSSSAAGNREQRARGRRRLLHPPRRRTRKRRSRRDPRHGAACARQTRPGPIPASSPSLPLATRPSACPRPVLRRCTHQRDRRPDVDDAARSAPQGAYCGSTARANASGRSRSTRSCAPRALAGSPSAPTGRRPQTARPCSSTNAAGGSASGAPTNRDHRGPPVEEAVAGLQAEALHLTRVAPDPPNLDALLGRPLPALASPADELDRRDQRAAPRQVDGVALSPATDVSARPGSKASGPSNSGRQSSATFCRSHGENPRQYIKRWESPPLLTLTELMGQIALGDPTSARSSSAATAATSEAS
jgi:hypothetical protein